jgi:arabinan endo-1,5-alpha-L-arabinosidase
MGLLELGIFLLLFGFINAKLHQAQISRRNDSMYAVRLAWGRRTAFALFCLVFLVACGQQQEILSAGLSSRTTTVLSAASSDPLAEYDLTGDVRPVHDPSIIRLGSTYYMFTTDVLGEPPTPSLPIRCSTDKLAWTACGSVFPNGVPPWVASAVPGVLGLWAPDVTYWDGLYRVYYSGSTLNSQRSVIGVATNVTLDPADPRYQWVDHGEVLASQPGDDFNAIDPNILVDDDSRVYLSYGSYWSGIKQIELDPTTGQVKQGAVRHDLATRPGVPNNPIEGASIVKRGRFYYLFVSEDYCCNQDVATDSYKEAFGRSTSPAGPFADMSGKSMLEGGGTVILDRDTLWNGPGGATAYVDSQTGESLLVFHALKMTENGAMYVWVKQIDWKQGWPVLE